MKIKIDFVTNSSSSSFIFKNNQNQLDIAEQMMEIIFEDDLRYVDDNPEWKKARKKTKTKAFNLLEKLRKESYHGNIAIPFSTNETTFIYNEPFKFCIRVDTCNNHDWNPLNIDHYLGEDEEFDVSRDDKFIDLSDGKIKTRDEVEKERWK